MVVVNNKDYFEAHLASLLADYDRDTLTNLYQPIIGAISLSLYFSLWSESNSQKVASLSTHEDMCLRMKIGMGDFVKARQFLEGIGLLKTYVEENVNNKFYHYELYAPKTPKEFFSDVLLSGLLAKNIGESAVNRLKSIYKTNFTNLSLAKDISSSFSDVFHPDFDDETFNRNLDSSSSLGRKKGKIDLEFSLSKFYDELKKISQISETALTKKEIKEISRLSTLYGVNEENAASIVAKLYEPQKSKGERVDLLSLVKEFMELSNYSYLSNKRTDYTKQTIAGDSALVHKLNLMEATSPKDFLTLLQNGTKPATSDLKIINELSKDFKLNNGVINVIIDFVLSVNNNVLSRNYATKIAGSVVREGAFSAYDAMNYLMETLNSRSARQETINKNKIKDENPTPSEVKEENKNDEDISWDDIFANIDNKD